MPLLYVMLMGNGYITCYDLEKKPFVSTNGEE